MEISLATVFCTVPVQLSGQMPVRGRRITLCVRKGLAQQGYSLFIRDERIYISGALRHASGLSTHTRIYERWATCLSNCKKSCPDELDIRLIQSSIDDEYFQNLG